MMGSVAPLHGKLEGRVGYVLRGPRGSKDQGGEFIGGKEKVHSIILTEEEEAGNPERVNEWNVLGRFPML